MLVCSIIFYCWMVAVRSADLPCPINCATCSSSTQCSTCADQYYSTTINSISVCAACSDYCLTCSSDTVCTECLDPYVLGDDYACYECVITNAATCSSTTSASTCISEYYASDNYCYSCLLNCAQCTSGYDCQSCNSGYYLNTTVLTCNPCPSHCTSCDQYTSSTCLSCADGYSLSGSYTCDAVTCTVDDCVYCSSTDVCGQCNTWMYWDGSDCVEGASVLCENGAEGPFPTECNNECTSFAFQENVDGDAFQCVPYLNVDVEDASYQQHYYYAYNQQQDLQTILSTSNTISSESNGEYSYLIEAGDTMSLTLSSYYQVIFTIKYISSNDVIMELSATTEQDSQTQNLTLPSQSSPYVQQLNTVAVHSNNLAIQFHDDVQLVELLLQVKKCPSDCYRCLNEQLCEMCNSPQYVQSYVCVDTCSIYYHLDANRSCLSECPDTYYHDNGGTNNKFCRQCQSPCVNCLSDEKCLSCESSLYLYNYTCLSECPDGYYISSQECAPCISPCKLCTDATTCLSCDEGYWDGSQCTNDCPSGTYGDNDTHECLDCTSPCLTCRNLSTICLTCQGSLYYHEYDCIDSCPDRYYPLVNLTCAQCQPPCSTCTSASDCLTCSYNYFYQNQCITSCPDGYYANITERQCSQCMSVCTTCEQATSCTSCNSGYYLLGECLDSCPSDQYYGVCDNGTCQCVQCSYPCDECTSISVCLSCLEGYLYDGQCLNMCPDGYYGNNDNFECDTCSSLFSDCLECDSSECTRCDSNLTLFEGECVSQCPDYYYESSQKCEKCIAPCSTCSSFTNCLSCIDPYILHSTSCMIQCPYDEVAIQVDGTTQCYSCQSPCLSCTESTTQCTLCIYGYYLINETCVTNCSALSTQYTYYNEDITSTCNSCMFPCETCSTQTACLSCRVGYLSGTKCEQCSYGTYASNGVCVDCPSGCANCYTAEYCTSCDDGYFLYDHQCITNSSICEQNGYYVSGKQCDPCQSPCSKCSTTSTNCTQCLSGYIFFGYGECYTQCPTGTYRNDSNCDDCHQYCETCSTTDTYCFSCKTGYYLYLGNMSCLESCPDGTYLEGSVCQSCRYPCQTCSSESVCLSCITGTLYGTYCYTSCPIGQFSNDDQECQNCTSPCMQCENISTNCTQCVDGYYLYEADCVSSCPSTYFAEEEAQQCLECLGLCKDCLSHINCTSCADDMIYYYDESTQYGECVSQCPISFYNTTSNGSLSLYECYSCLVECLTCVNDEECVLCTNNMVQYDGQCWSECPAQMYAYEGICQECEQPCFNCSDTYTCTACMNDSFLLVGSAECVVGEVCPFGYYLISGTRNCNGECPDGQYHRNDRTCSADGCDTNEFMGADMFCYITCPNNYIANTTFHCTACDDTQCQDGLFFNLYYSIKNDELFVYMIFTEEPKYLQTPSLSLSPTFDFVTISEERRMLMETVSSTRNITFQIVPTESFTEVTLEVSIDDPLLTFSNPLQSPTETIYLQGFDIYPTDLPTISVLGLLALACALVGLVKNPYMVDFGQILFLLALLNIHYPLHLASALESTNLGQMVNIIPVQQTAAQGQHKFSYVTNMGLLSNATFNLIILITGLLVALLMLGIYEGLKRSANYNRVDDESEEANEQAEENNEAGQQSNEPKKPSQATINAIKNLQTFFSCFKMQYLNRLVYFNYLPLTFFSITQLEVIDFSAGGTDTIAAALAILMIIPIIGYPIFIFRTKPKYCFLCVRKITMSMALWMSMDYPTYMIGVGAVVSLTSAVLIMTYKLESWKHESRFIMVGEVFQFLLFVILAIFTMIGNGNFTTAKVYLAWAIIAWVIIICMSYLSFSLFQLVLWCCKRYKNVDYKDKWAKEESKTEHDNDSESNPDEIKQVETRKQENQPLSSKSVQFEKLFLQLQKQDDSQVKNDPNQNNMFWTYNENEDEDDSKTVDNNRPPQMLIRCVNEFSEMGSEKPDDNEN